MIFRHSIRTRIVIAYSIFGAVLGTVFAVVVYVSLDFIDDNLVNHRLTREVDFLVERFKEGTETVKPSSAHIKAFIGINRMPSYARQMVQGLEEGFHEVYNHIIKRMRR